MELTKEEKNWISFCFQNINPMDTRVSWIIDNKYLLITINAFKQICPSIQYKITPEFRDASELILEWSSNALKIYN